MCSSSYELPLETCPPMRRFTRGGTGARGRAWRAGDGGEGTYRRSVEARGAETVADLRGRVARSGRLEPRAVRRRSAALGDRHVRDVDVSRVDREVSTHSIALLTMRAPNARTGAAAHMYMMFFAVVGSIFVCRRPIDARGRVRSRALETRRSLLEKTLLVCFQDLFRDFRSRVSHQQHPPARAPPAAPCCPSPSPTVAAPPPASRPPAP